MPRVTSSHFLAGYIRAKMDQLKAIIHKLEDKQRVFTLEMCEHLHEEIEEINREVMTQLRFLDKEESKSEMTEYRRLSQMVVEKLQN